MTGFATSVIGCGCEAGVDYEVPARETPDGRPGVRILLFAMSSKDAKSNWSIGSANASYLSRHSGVLRSRGSSRSRSATRFASSAISGRCRSGRRPPLLARAGDGRRIPLRGQSRLDQKIRRRRQSSGHGRRLGKRHAATEAGVEAVRAVKDAIAPFPGGIVRSGSKVGSKYKGMGASTNDALLSDTARRDR